MTDREHTPIDPTSSASKELGRDMEHLQAIESNPLDREQLALFERFEREGWSHERRRRYLLERARRAGVPSHAAE